VEAVCVEAVCVEAVCVEARTARCPAVCAANDVLRLAPLNPTDPHDAHVTVAPNHQKGR
jgi:hypothetical protein